MSRNLILHAFLQPIRQIINNLDKIKEQNFNMIQLTPCQPKKYGSQWWTIYQIEDFTIGNEYGSKDDLKELCEKAHNLGIKIIQDIIVEHCSNEGGGDLSLVPHHNIPQKFRDNPYIWKEKKIINDWDNRWEVTNWCMGLPAMRTDNWDLQNEIIKFMNELIDIGVDGFRIDCAKAISLPEEDGNTFWTRVFGDLHKKDELFNYGELIFCDKWLLDKYSKYINVLTNGVCSDRNKLVSFFISHDSDLEFGYTKNMTDDMVTKEWEVLLKSNRESSMLFYARPNSNLWMSERIKYINKEFN